MLSLLQKQETADNSKDLFSQLQEDGIKVETEMYQKAKNNVAEGFYKIGNAYYNRGTTEDYEKAMIWYKKSAAKGYPAGVHDVGYLYMLGHGTCVNYKLAMEYFIKAADLKFAMAMYNIGYLYRFGLGFDVNYPLAVEWFNNAINQGNECAPKALGVMYLEGVGVDTDYKLAMSLFQKAHDRGNTEVPSYIGTMYEKGFGVSVDKQTALYWYDISAKYGCSSDKTSLERLESEGYYLIEKIPKALLESENGWKEKKKKRSEKRELLKKLLDEEELDRKEWLNRILILEDDNRKLAERISDFEFENYAVGDWLHGLEFTLMKLSDKLDKFMKIKDGSSIVNTSKDGKKENKSNSLNSDFNDLDES